MNKLLSVGFIGLCAVTLVGCSDSGNQKVKVSDEQKSEQSSTTEKVAEKKESSIGKRSNPVPFGQTGTFSATATDEEWNGINMEISLTLSNIVRGEQAYNELVAENQFNDAAPEGMEWVLVTIEGAVIESENPDVNYNFYDSFTVFDSSGKSINQSVYAVTPNEFSGEVYEGASIEGQIAIIVPTNDNFLLEYNGGNSKIYFATQ